MSRFGIIGAGFGLYGYLPALIDGCAHHVVLSERYRNRFFDRPELSQYSSAIDWREDEEAILDCVDGVVLALPPLVQQEILPRCLARSSIKKIILEKPLANTPEVATEIFSELIQSRKEFRVGYTFRYTDWGKKILKKVLPAKKGNSSFSINWSFFAHHYRHDLYNWKRSNAQGGGAIRFYGIQIIALLAEIGYRDVTLSRSYSNFSDEIEKWDAVFVGQGLPECKIVVSTNSNLELFQVENTVNSECGASIPTFTNLTDPFDLDDGTYQMNRIDRRVPILIQLCNSFRDDSEHQYECYNASIVLWQIIENKTIHEILKVNGSDDFRYH